jgi:bifunctional non-homologous end joining protein LigD
MRVSAFIEPCLPSPADRPPSGPDWIHEIKLDGFRMMVRRDPAGVRLLTRNGYDWTGRFPRIAAAAEALRTRSFLIDGEAVLAPQGIQLNEHCDDLPVDVVFRHACKLGFEGIVSKRVGSPYRSGRSRDWLKMKNPNAPAVKREAEEDWGR